MSQPSFPEPWRRAAQRGQATTEYLMMAAVLVTVAMVFNAYLPQAFRTLARGVIGALSPIAP